MVRRRSDKLTQNTFIECGHDDASNEGSDETFAAVLRNKKTQTEL
jgi:hypothetical protein